jgi:hypothetical protein
MTILIPVLNPGPGAKGRRKKPVKKAKRRPKMRVIANRMVVTGKKGNELKPSGAAFKAALEAIKQGEGRRLKDGRISLKVGGQQRYVERVAGTSLGRPVPGKVRRPTTRAQTTKRGKKRKTGIEVFEERSAAPRTTRAAAKLKAARAKAAKKKAAQRKRDKAKTKRMSKKAGRKIAGSHDYARAHREVQRAKRASRSPSGSGYVRGRSHSARPKKKGGGNYGAVKITFSEAAHSSGAVFPAKYPKGHPGLSGQPHPKAGRAMSFFDALVYERPIVGYLSRPMIKGYYKLLDTQGKKAAQDYLDTARFGGVRLKDGTYIPNATQRSARGKGGTFAAGKKKAQKKKVQKALDSARGKGAKIIKGMEQIRRERGSAWTRTKQVYGRSGSTPKGKRYIKGRKKPDYTQYWSDSPASWQTPGGDEYLRVRFRRGRGPKVSLPLYRGFGPTSTEVELLESGGFGGPTDAPGGRVKLNRGRRGRRKKVRRRKNPQRNSKGHFVKTKRNPKRRKKKKATGRKRRRTRRKTKTVAAYNPRRRKRRRRKKRKNPARRRNSKGHFVKTKRNPKRRRYRRKKTTAKRNPHKRRRRRRIRRNQGVQAALAPLQKKDLYIAAAHVLVGMSGTAVLSGMAMNALMPKLAYGQTWGMKIGRFAVRVATAGLLSAGIKALGNVKMLKPVIGPRASFFCLVGGVAYSLADLLSDVFTTPLIPKIQAGRGRAPASAGMEDFLELSGMGGSGMGAVMSPYDLVSGESAARLTNDFAGMGGSGGAPIPLEDIRGLGYGYAGWYGGGMNDFMELSDLKANTIPPVAQGPETF